MSCAALRSSPSRLRRPSVICRSTLTTGLRAVIGSWKTIAICVPHTSRRSTGERLRDLVPGEADCARVLDP